MLAKVLHGVKCTHPSRRRPAADLPASKHPPRFLSAFVAVVQFTHVAPPSCVSGFQTPIVYVGIQAVAIVHTGTYQALSILTGLTPGLLSLVKSVPVA